MTAVGAVAAGAAVFGAWWLVWGFSCRGLGGACADRASWGGWLGSAPVRFARDLESRVEAGIDVGPLQSALVLELVAAMLDAGSSLPRALGIAARVSGLGDGVVGRAAAALELGVAWDQAWPEDGSDAEVSEIRRSLQFAAATGAPSAQLISARARLLRRARHRELERRAAALGVRLVIPLGACSLPAFLCLGVLPVLISMMPS